ncbi:pentatricopeptide repeat-containing protein At1g04840 [Impatiens glandulifera]|uniref:pentatricopeptide repeat-containing protein At1g04840 n=1 Tax=Impatiens glandulifera TaxID=253017 RepID=UPI001FB054D2|nr:pentatricopeptide repeat-containing protein At1g04840 [Impatiens glandulifera]
MRSLHALFRSTTAEPIRNTIPIASKISEKFGHTSNGINDQQETQFISLIHSSRITQHLQQIHAQIIVRGLSFNSRIVTQFISASSLLKSSDYALSIFKEFGNPNVYVFNALIRGLTENSRFKISISHFVLMMGLNIYPNQLTFPYVLKSAAALFECDLGRAIHGEILKLGHEFDSFVRVSLVDMYVKMEILNSALQVFDESPERNKNESLLLWNVLINGCCKAGDLVKAMELFDTMPERTSGSWNSLINGFMTNGEVEKAKELFNNMPEKNVVSWTTMVKGFSQNGENDKSLSMFFTMLEQGVKPNDLTVVSALSASSKIGALDSGVRIHNYLTNNHFALNKVIGAALVDMYGKCGRIDTASQIFDKIKHKDLRTWSVMIWGWAIHGCFEQALDCFTKMISTRIKPDEVVFLAILTACLHSRQPDKALEIFDSMRNDHSIEPAMKHYTLIVDILGRAGRLAEARSFINKMPMDPDFVIWGALFSACRAHKDVEMAELASKKLLQLQPDHPGVHVFLSNVYADVERWDDVERVRSSMKGKGVEKDPGWSFIEVDGKVHSFHAGDNGDDDHMIKIYKILEEMSRNVRRKGYFPGTEWVLHNIEEEEKEGALWSHSEKLALAFGLISTEAKTTIRIVNNQRICGDCHSMMKYASETTEREIILRDIKRFHHFKDGVCSCGDYW